MEFEFVKGYENLYKINRNGDIYSCWYKKNIIPQETEDGYLWVKLSNEEGRKKYRLHRLLSIQFIDNPDNLPEVDHIDRNKNNNSISNLRWVSRIINRRNRDDVIENMTDEQKEERLNKIREYKKVWAEKDRREKGIKEKVKGFDENEYHKEYNKKKRANETSEQKDLRLQKRREQYKLNKDKI